MFDGEEAKGEEDKIRKHGKECFYPFLHLESATAMTKLLFFNRNSTPNTI